MWKLTLKGLLAHRVRLVSTTLSVVLGVAFVAGTFVLTDTMTAVFDDLVRGGSQSVDVIVRSAKAADTEIGTVDAYYGAVPLDAEVLDAVAGVDGVEVAEGGVEGYVLIVRPDGEPIMPMGPPTLGVSWSDVAGRTLEPGGRAPRGGEEVVVDATTAHRNDLAIGDRLEIVFARIPPRAFTLVGFSSAEGGENLAGATLAEFDLATAQEVLDLEGAFTAITVWGSGDLDPEVLTDRVAAVVPAGVEAISAADWADETMAEIEGALAFVTIALGVFAAVALLVGAFIIANTFSITVLQRSREFALLRALGASRRQIVAVVVGEASGIGLLASLGGILAGLGLARGLQALLSLFGMDMPSGALVVQPRTVAVSLGVGMVVTVVSALLPARRASSMPPIAALRSVQTGAYRSSRLRLGTGTGAAAAATGLLAYAAVARPDAGGTVLGVGALLAFVALGLTGPALTRPVLRVLGGKGDHLGVPGHLARSNSMRTPRRTWTTAAALTVGVALVSSVAVISASMKASAAGALDATLRADVIVSAGGTFTAGALPPVVARQIAQSPDVAAVSPLRFGSGQIDGVATAAVALDPTAWHEVHATDAVAGVFAEVAGQGAVAVDADLADEHGYEVGDVVTASFPASGPTTAHRRPVRAGPGADRLGALHRQLRGLLPAVARRGRPGGRHGRHGDDPCSRGGRHRGLPGRHGAGPGRVPRHRCRADRPDAGPGDRAARHGADHRGARDHEHAGVVGP
jgi:putative ABC transport system permease protein